MSTPSRQSILILLVLGASVFAPPAFGEAMHAPPGGNGGDWGHHGGRWGNGGAIAAGVAGGVAGTMAGQMLAPPGYTPPQQDCVWEQEMVQKPYSFHIGQVRVCQ